MELSFPVSLGIDPISPKRRQGDGATPEGLYYITYLKDKSRFHKFIGISYPNAVDAWLGRRAGIITLQEEKKILETIQKRGAPPQDTLLGGGIGIHGGGVIRKRSEKEVRDWTEGCIAMDNQAIDRLFELCRPGTQVIIYNSKASFFDMMRPFAYPVDLCDTGKEYSSNIGFVTNFGPILLNLKEWDNYGRSVRILVFAKGVHHPPTCEVLDRNGDGKMGFKDQVKGGLPGIRSKEIYRTLQNEIVKALSQGRIRVETTGWSP